MSAQIVSDRAKSPAAFAGAMGKQKSSTTAQAKQSPVKQENGHSSKPAVNGHKQESSQRQPTLIKINSDKIHYGKDEIISNYDYQLESCSVSEQNGVKTIDVNPKTIKMQFKTQTHVPKTGLLLVGLGGNNGSTLVAGILANKHRLSWETRTGTQQANFFGSLTQASTLKLGTDAKGKDVYIPFNEMLPMIKPTDLVIHGWDISSMNLGDAMKRSQVLEPTLRLQLEAEMREIKPMPSIYYPDFIAANQADRADNLIPGNDKWQHLEQIRKDIRDFKAKNGLEKVIIVWTANTERFAELIPGVNDTADNLLKAIKNSHPEVSPSTVFAVAAILESVPFINGSPQNSCTGGVIELAEQHKSFIGGDDFKSGQTKMKSALVEFLVNAGLKVTSIASYNHLGNNDGKNLSAPSQFRSKEISKSNVVDDMVGCNNLLYKEGEHPGHLVVIKYLPEVGDSKRALDEYTCEIFLGGKQTISMHNVCEDSLLATPLIIDLCVLAELFTRIQYKTESDKEWMGLHSVLSLLSYMLKAPLVKKGTPVINALSKQRAAIENVMRACLGIAPNNEMMLEHKMWDQSTKNFH